jgi:hypothetical protein
VRAYKDTISFDGVSGPGVIVDFEKSWRLLFWTKLWAGASQWDLGNDLWITNEWMEVNSIEDTRWFEPMMDVEARYSRIDILESGDARARVRWHYALCNPEYEIFNGNTTADEYYTVYPDGIAVRRLVGWPGNESDYGGNPNFWELGEFIMSYPGRRRAFESGVSRETLMKEIERKAKEILETERWFTIQDIDGKEIVYSWPMPSPRRAVCSEHPEIADFNAYIMVEHLKDRPDHFVVVPHNKALYPYRPSDWPPAFTHSPGCHRDHPQFLLWAGMNTTPVSYGFCYTPFERPPRPTVWNMLTGATEDSSPTRMSEIAASWLNRATIEITSEGPPRQLRLAYMGYRWSERAHVIDKGKIPGDKLSFVMRPTEWAVGAWGGYKKLPEDYGKTKVINPVFVIKDWSSSTVSVKLDGNPLDASEYRWHVTQDNLIMWLNRDIEQDTEFEIAP